MTTHSYVCSTMWCSSVEIALQSKRVGAEGSPAHALEVFLLQICYSRVLWKCLGAVRAQQPRSCSASSGLAPAKMNPVHVS